MPLYFVHWNRIRKRVRIHTPECEACNNGAGTHRGKTAAGGGNTYDWIKAKSYHEAVFRATGLNMVIGTNGRIAECADSNCPATRKDKSPDISNCDTQSYIRRLIQKTSSDVSTPER